MAEALGVAGSIVGIVSFGLQFATALQTYIEAVSDAENSLQDIAFDVSATASALQQLHDFIGVDSAHGNDQGKKPALNEAGLKEIGLLSSKCQTVYTAIAVLLTKASGQKDKIPSEVTPDVASFGAFKATMLCRKLRWPWLEPRIKKYQEQLRWLKMSLLFHLQLAQLAKTRMQLANIDLRLSENLLTLTLRTSVMSPRSFEDELAVNIIAEGLRKRREALTKKLAARSKKSKVARDTSAESSDYEDKPSPSKVPVEPSSTTFNEPLVAAIPQRRVHQDEDINPSLQGSSSVSGEPKVPEGPPQRTKEPYKGVYMGTTSGSLAPAREAERDDSCDTVQIVRTDGNFGMSNSTQPSDQVATMGSNHAMKIVAAESPKSVDPPGRQDGVGIGEQQKASTEHPAKAGSNPVHVIYLRSAGGRRHVFALDLCRTWMEMEILIRQAFTSGSAALLVQHGHYDLLDQNANIILPSMWSKLVTPGWELNLHLWATSIGTIPNGVMYHRQEPGYPGNVVQVPAGIRPGLSPAGRGMARRGPAGGPPPPPPPNLVRRSAITSMLSHPRRVSTPGRGPKAGASRFVDGDSSTLESSLASRSDSVDVDEQDLEELEIIDFAKETENAQAGLGDLLVRWTNSTDVSTYETLDDALQLNNKTDSDSESDTSTDYSLAD